MRKDFTSVLDRAARVRFWLDHERRQTVPSWLRLIRLQRLNLLLARRLNALALAPVLVTPSKARNRRVGYAFG